MNRKGIRRLVGAALVGWLGLAVGPLVAQTAISADGVVESTTGGLKFPDGSIQTAAAVSGSAPVEDTGQTGCWDTDGNPRTCSGTGEDGELQPGVAWPTPRFTDNLDGTATDNLTGLIWLQDANCPSALTWQQSLDWVAAFNSGSPACNNYSAGTFSDWRLPSIKELLSLMDFGQSSPALPSPNPFMGVQSAFYWSSSSYVPIPTSAWGVILSTGLGSLNGKAASNPVWPVRGGP